MGQIVKKNESNPVEEHGVSTFHEYHLSSDKICIGVSEINGKYPKSGYECDTAVDQIWYVEFGEGFIWLNEKVHSVAPGDVLLVEKGEKYWINGKNLKLVVFSSPPWTLEQHTHIE